jgi:hypothetical protein
MSKDAPGHHNEHHDPTTVTAPRCTATITPVV